MKTHQTLVNDIRSAAMPMGRGAFWWLGQLGYVYKLGKAVICIDHFFSDHPDRLRKPILDADEPLEYDIVMGTHDHMDHIDRQAWTIIADRSPKTTFVVPNACVGALSEAIGIPPDRFVGINDARTVRVGDVEITGVASAHEFLDRDPFTGEHPYMGYVIRCNGVALYHSGDSCLYEGLIGKLKALSPFDAVFLPINGRDGARYRAGCIGNMCWQEAADLTGALRPALAVPGHYDMFANNVANPLDYTDYLEAKYPEQEFWIGGHGVKVEFGREGQAAHPSDP